MDNKLLIGVTFIVILIYVVHHYVRRAHLTSASRHLWFNTAIFMAIGIAIGPSGFRLLEGDDIRMMAPLVDILLGWIGWLIGIELTRKMVHLIPKRYWFIGMAENFVTLCITILLFLGIALLFKDLLNIVLTPPFILLAGLCAAVSSPRSIITLTRRLHIPRDIARGYAVVAHLGNLGVMFLMYLLIYFYNWQTGEYIIIESTFKLVALGILQGLTMSWLFLYRRDTPESMLILIGVIIFFAGAAAFLEVPALMAGLIGGGFFAYFFPNRQPQLMSALQQSERPIYLLFVTLASINIPLSDIDLYLFLIPFILFRAIAKLTSGFFLKRSLSDTVKGGWYVGVFIPQGALAIAIALSAFQLFPNAWDKILVATVVIGLFFNELLGYQVLRFISLSKSYD